MTFYASRNEDEVHVCKECVGCSDVESNTPSCETLTSVDVVDGGTILRTCASIRTAAKCSGYEEIPK